ncbi:MAG TPA: glycosyl hydrolase family 28 protein [Woeseiaceae bacterium]|nr:glycosyl hydrolase family 28 protein [Woeseiaceae bacterium]
MHATILATILAVTCGSLALAGLAAVALANPAADAAPWTMADEIVAAIDLPVIPEGDYAVTNFGAIAGDGRDDRPAILAAIAAAVEAGGGRVVVPAGEWYSAGPVVLESRIELHLADGATLLFSPRAADYLPVVRTRWEGTMMMGYSPLIYAAGVEDVAITGKGRIDGNAGSEFHAWNSDEHEPRLPHADMLRLRQMGIDGVPLEERVFGEGTHLRPSAVQFLGARRVLLEDYTINNSPFWINHLVFTEHATVRRLKVDSHWGNNDGVDVDSSSYVLIEDNWFRTGDDSVVVKSGRDRDGRDIGIPSEYVVVRNNDMGGEDGIALGSEMSGDVRYVFFDNNVLRKGSSAIRFKANLDRGGTVEHIRVRNFTVETFENLFWFQLKYPGDMGGNYPSTYRDIVFENFTVEKVSNVLVAHAPAVAPLSDVTLRNVAIGEADVPLVLENVDALTFDNVTIGDQRIDAALAWRNETEDEE